MGFRQRLMQFMYGRYISYGMDLLSRILIVVCIVLAVVNLFIGSILVQLIETALLFYYLFRLFSKNIAARQKENNVLVGFKNKIVRALRLEKRKFRERESHIYKTCPHCRVTLRLPRKPGRHNVNCPRCRNNFEVKVKS